MPEHLNNIEIVTYARVQSEFNLLRSQDLEFDDRQMVRGLRLWLTLV